MIHQAVAVKAAVDALDASFQEDRDTNVLAGEVRQAEQSNVIYALPNSDGTAFSAGTGTLIGNKAVDPRVTRAALPGDVLDLYI